jgi:hypothetical protein
MMIVPTRIGLVAKTPKPTESETLRTWTNEGSNEEAETKDNGLLDED